MFQVRVVYPAGPRGIVLRTSLDWAHDVAPSAVSAGRDAWDFAIDAGGAPSIELKPGLVDVDGVAPSVGRNYVVRGDRTIAPYFASPAEGAIVEDLQVADAEGRTWRVDVYLPAGYAENTARRYPVLYFQDGQHVFAPVGPTSEWQVDEALDVLDQMDMVEKVIAVAVHVPDEGRTGLYTSPGWDRTRRFLVDRLVPFVDGTFRTRAEAGDRTLVGASLGAVVSLHVAWEHPEVFRNVVALSGTFGLLDDLPARVRATPRPPLTLYLDSGSPPFPGSPSDNLERVRAMVEALLDAGYRQGEDLQYYVVPRATHTEREWALRWNIAFQWLYGKI
jgi:predicted alpha/beta superfamily hydrolase